MRTPKRRLPVARLMDPWVTRCGGVLEPGDVTAAEALAADPAYVGTTRTTCIPTRFATGHADNVLPQRAVVTVNCRIFPECRRRKWSNIRSIWPLAKRVKCQIDANDDFESNKYECHQCHSAARHDCGTKLPADASACETGEGRSPPKRAAWLTCL